MAENKKVMEEEAVDTKETKAEQTCEETCLLYTSPSPRDA